MKMKLLGALMGCAMLAMPAIAQPGPPQAAPAVDYAVQLQQGDVILKDFRFGTGIRERVTDRTGRLCRFVEDRASLRHVDFGCWRARYQKEKECGAGMRRQAIEHEMAPDLRVGPAA